jgi:hypothetical protein
MIPLDDFIREHGAHAGGVTLEGDPIPEGDGLFKLFLRCACGARAWGIITTKGTSWFQFWIRWLRLWWRIQIMRVRARMNR